MDNQLLSKRPRCGYGFIYCYTSPSGKKYIGQTRTTLKERAKTTNYSGYKNCIAFYNAIQKYGITNFEIEIIAECPLDVINSEEEKYISLYDSTNPNKGYNIDDGRKQMIALVNRIPVFEYDGITGNFIREFSSINEASRYYGCYRTSIERAVNGTHAQRSQGNLWRTYKVD